jgi:hypothetical protein
MYKFIFCVCFAVFFTGCSNNPVPKPGAITLENALVDTVKSIKAMEKEAGNVHLGFLPEVTATFNISATETDKDNLYVEIGAPANPYVSGKLGNVYESTYVGTRGNQITVKFTNVFLADEKTVINKLITNKNSPSKENGKKEGDNETLSPTCGRDPSKYKNGIPAWIRKCQKTISPNPM